MSREKVAEILRTYLGEVAGISAESVGPDSSIDGDLEMNSVTFVELQVALEEHFDILIDPIAVIECNQFEAIVDYLHSLVRESSE